MVLPYKVGEYVAASFRKKPRQKCLGFAFYNNPSRSLALFLPISLLMLKRTLLLLFLLPGILHAQKRSITKKDSASVPADSLVVTLFNEFQLNEFAEGRSYNTISNNLDNFQIFHLKNANLGNAGSAEKYLYLQHLPSNGFSRSNSAFGFFGRSDQNRTFYSCDKPYTGLAYIVGQKQEANIQMIHAHPLGKNALVAM